MVLEDPYAGVEQAAVERLRRVVQQAVLDSSLQHDGDCDAALRGVTQRLPEAASGQEIGVGDQDRVAGVGDRRQVGVFDRAPMPDVVANDEGRQLLAVRRRRRRRTPGDAVAVFEVHPTDDFPKPLHDTADRQQQRTFDTHGVVVARRQARLRFDVVDDVDAADESDFVVDDRQFAVQAAQAVAAQVEARQLGTIDDGHDSGID